MKRLTFEGNFCDIAMCDEVRGGSFCEDGDCSQRKIWERLKAIENILGDEYDLGRLWKLAQADREGRCMVPLCKAGDTVYAFSQMRDKRILPFVKEYEITSIRINKRSLSYYHEKDGFIKIMKQSDFGKTVFLTSAEAEAALQRGQDG